MSVEPDLSIAAKFGHARLDPILHIFKNHRAGRIYDIHALASSISHDARLPGDQFGRLAVRHHEEANSFESELSSQTEMLN